MGLMGWGHPVGVSFGADLSILLSTNLSGWVGCSVSNAGGMTMKRVALILLLAAVVCSVGVRAILRRVRNLRQDGG